MGDHRYYYNFDQEIKLENWNVALLEKNRAVLQCRIAEPEGDYLFLAPCLDADKSLWPEWPHLKSFSVNGCPLPLSRLKAVYIHDKFARYGIKFHMSPGNNHLEAEISLPGNGKYDLPNLFFSLLRTEPPSAAAFAVKKIKHEIPAEKYSRNRDDFDPAGWEKGIGHQKSPGRFGFSKGDGLLDCAMPSLGIVDKMFLCGQEKYRKPYRWCYSLLPEGMPLHGTYPPNDVGIEGDEIDVNPLSVRWAATYNGKRFSCTYSLAAPGILTENENGSMLLSNLQFAGNYQSILIPRQDGIEETALDEASIAGMAENWILLFNSTEFPDVPLMLVFDRNPASMKTVRDTDGRLNAVEFSSCPLMLSCTPFGIERFDPGRMKVEDAVRRCRFWSRALLAYPVRCRDYFQLDKEKEIVTVRQKFEYRYLKDSWGTEPLELAPFPPPLSICGTSECRAVSDFEFPTKYGWLRGRIGCWSEYTLPFMPLERKFPLCGEDSTIPELLRKGMKKYQDLVSRFGPEKVSYPYAGAILEPFAFASTLSFFMNENDREFLRQHLAKAIQVAADENAQSDYTVISWREMMQNPPEHDEVIRIYHDPEKKHLQLYNWFDRIEPFTGAAFKICYINVCLFSSGKIKIGSRDEVQSLRIPLIENDWGAGLTFYYLYLSSLASGSFAEIRKNWKLLKQVYSFFDLMHDWACMGTGYSDNAITWVEGANYGLFPAYIRMAEAAGDSEAHAFGIYNAAKQLVLRLAIMRSSQVYFPKYFETDPWYCAKHFHEEAQPFSAFQNVPKLFGNRLRRDAVYNFTTEGLYPEAYVALRKFGGESYDTVMKRLENGLLNGLDIPDYHWVIIQEYAGMMIDHALNERSSVEHFTRLLDYGLRNGLIMKEWRGIHIFSRILPENYLRCQLLAWMEMRDHKLWLEHWEEMRIDSAVWSDGKAQIRFTPSGAGPMKLICGVTVQPDRIELDGKSVSYRKIRSDKIEIVVKTGGTLLCIFPGEVK